MRVNQVLSETGDRRAQQLHLHPVHRRLRRYFEVAKLDHTEAVHADAGRQRKKIRLFEQGGILLGVAITTSGEGYLGHAKVSIAPRRLCVVEAVEKLSI